MELKHERRTNTAFVNTLELELSGNQISLSERPKTKDSSLVQKKFARSLRPCTLRRPMSATPSFGYRGSNRSKTIPPWSRPQSAEGSTGLRRGKLAAKFSDPSLHDPDYCAEFGITYTLSSSQLLNSLMGSCSINEGLDSDSTPAPSPQPSLGDTIKVAAQLEPGLTSKPPLPPTPSPLANTSADDIINLKFQRWFPDAISESDIVGRTSLVITPFEKQTEETDLSEDGGSIVEGALSSNRNEHEQLTALPITNVSTFVKKIKIPSDNKVDKLRFDGSKDEQFDAKFQDVIPPKIVIHEPDCYGCDIVTEEFFSDKQNVFLTKECVTSLKKPCEFEKVNNDKTLAISEPSLSQPDFPGNRNSKKDSELHSRSKNVATSSNEFLDSGFLKVNSKNFNNYASNDVLPSSRNDVESPFGFETSASKYRLTSTPIAYDNAMHSSSYDDCKNTPLLSNEINGIEKQGEKNYSSYPIMKKVTEYDVEIEHKKYNSLSSPVRLQSDENEVCHDQPRQGCNKSVLEDKMFTNNRSNEIMNKNSITKNLNDTTRSEQQEKHAHFSNTVKSFNSLPLVVDEGKQDKQLQVKNTTSQSVESSNIDNFSNSCDEISAERKFALEKNLNSDEDRNNNDDTSTKIYELLCKHRIGDKGSKISCQNTLKPVKEVCRAASVPPYPSSKPSKSQLKKINVKDANTSSQISKKKTRRSMSYDSAVSPDILEKDSGVSSYEDIVTMIKVLEKEDLESPILKYKSSTDVETLIPDQSSSAKAILNFLDEVEKGTSSIVCDEKSRNLLHPSDENASSRSCKGVPVSSRLGTLLNADTADLAQQVMTLTLQLEEVTAVGRAMEERYKQSVNLLKQQKVENDESNKRQQQFVDQLLKEKRQLAVQYETSIKELEAKHETAIKVIEERHKIEIKKAQEKFNAAEKIRRDKWIDAKTKKIKGLEPESERMTGTHQEEITELRRAYQELTVKGLEPELERMAVTHQEEIAELRRVHQRHLEEAEAAWSRRMTALREQEASERQAAIQHEREAARHRLEQEMNQVEKSYQEQRRRLLEEVRQEKELLHRQSERLVAEKQAELARQVDETKKKLQEKMADHEKQQQEELGKVRDCLETEKAAWIARQRATLEEKELVMREELKRERDRHIELAIRQLETEAAAREQAIENKLKRLKESYDAEVNDLDSTMKELRSRLKNARADLQKSEDVNTTLRAQLSQAQSEVLPLKQMIDKLRKENHEALCQSEAKVLDLQHELTDTKQSFSEQMNKVHTEKEKQLQQVYTRVKEAINKKEEALVLITKQRDAALDQCSRLEKLLENQRMQALKL